MPDNFFESHGEAKRAMKENLFSEVYLSTTVATPVHVKGWVNHSNLYQRHGKRWHLYQPRVEMLKKLAMRFRKSGSSAIENRPA